MWVVGRGYNLSVPPTGCLCVCVFVFVCVCVCGSNWLIGFSQSVRGWLYHKCEASQFFSPVAVTLQTVVWRLK